MGNPLFDEKLSEKKKWVTKEVIQGHKFAAQLQILLKNEKIEDGSPSPSAEELVLNILRSFDGILSVLTSTETGEVSQNTQNEISCGDSPCFDDRRSENSVESRKRPAKKDKRGCYKRKNNSETLAVVSSTIDDGHAWRKYGQKEILNTKNPRSYYRCTHKHDQGCKAGKQVQKLDESEMYQLTYIGNHTCSDTTQATQIITNSNNQWGTYVVAPKNNLKQICHQPIKEESKTESSTTTTTATTTTLHYPKVTDNLSTMESVMWNDLVPFDQSTSHFGFEIDFGSSFCFDENEFF